MIGISLITIASECTKADNWINVISPSIGETYYEGGTYYISWSSSGAGNYVEIKLYGSGNYYTIVSNTSNSGSYQWTIASVPYSGSYQIIISSLSTSANAVSDGFYIYKRTITVTHPPMGEIWYSGDTHRINWDSENAGQYVEIYCIYGSTTYTIDSYTYNDGIYDWVIPSSLPSGSSYRIKIVSVSYGNVYDYSEYFSISARSITITSPLEGNEWYKGETYTLTWNSENVGDYIAIELYYNDYYYSTINSNTENDGLYLWMIPSGLLSNRNYQIKITSNSYNTIYDYSEYFSIDERSITLNYPRTGDTLYKGDTYTITWSSVNAGEYVSIELYEDGWYLATIISNVTNDGSYSWEIPNYIASSSSSNIKIKSITYNNLYGISEYFSLEGRTITVNLPYDDETWYKGEDHIITWDSSGAGDYVNIELYKDGQYYSSIASDVSNDGDYPWKIPSDIPSGSYQIKITSKSYDNVSAYSSGYLKIDDTLLQKSLGTFVIILVIVIVLIVIFIVLKRRKGKTSKPEKEVKGDTPGASIPTDISHQTKAEKISDDEYEQIWERNKHK